MYRNEVAEVGPTFDSIESINGTLRSNHLHNEYDTTVTGRGIQLRQEYLVSYTQAALQTTVMAGRGYTWTVNYTADDGTQTADMALGGQTDDEGNTVV